MKYMVLFFMLLFYSRIINAGDMVEDVYEYNQGSCWIKENKDQGLIKIVDFNSGRAKSFSYEILFDGMEEASRDAIPKGFSPVDYRSYIHCNAGGLKFILNMVIDDGTKQNHRVCMHFDILGSEIKLTEMGILDQDAKGDCEGNDPYKLLGSINDKDSFESHVRPVLESLIENNILQNYDLSNKYLVLNLVKDNLGNLKIAEEKLHDLVEKKYLRYIEKNSYYLPIGEFVPLEMDRRNVTEEM